MNTTAHPRLDSRMPTTGARFSILLATLVALLFLPTALEPMGLSLDSTVARGVFMALFFFVLLSSVLAVAEARRNIIIAGSLAVVSGLVRLIQLFHNSPSLMTLYLWLSLILLAYVAVLMLGYLFRTRVASYDTIAAALSVYLLIAVIWGLGYVLVDMAEPGSFRGSALPEGMSFMSMESQSLVYPFYYSLVTLTTLGYGDIVPTSRLASMLAALEAVVGQVYMAVLVARLVGLQIASSRR